MNWKPAIAAVVGAVFLLGAGGSPSGDACSLLTQAQVISVLGVPVGAGQPLVPNSPKICGWSEPGDFGAASKRIVVTITTPESFTRGKTPLKGITATPANGIGDDAYYITTPGFGTGLSVLKGSSAFQIRAYGKGFSPDQIKDMEKTLAQDILAKM